VHKWFPLIKNINLHVNTLFFSGDNVVGNIQMLSFQNSYVTSRICFMIAFFNRSNFD